jgi:hypothetical protein
VKKFVETAKADVDDEELTMQFLKAIGAKSKHSSFLKYDDGEEWLKRTYDLEMSVYNLVKGGDKLLSIVIVRGSFINDISKKKSELDDSMLVDRIIDLLIKINFNFSSDVLDRLEHLGSILGPLSYMLADTIKERGLVHD